MNENKIIDAKNDKRVNYNFLINDRINVFSALPSDNPTKIVIYCHGLGASKDWVSRFYDELLNSNIGVFAFDFPGHGNDNTDFSNFNLSLCISYLNDVINYVRKKYKDSKIYLFGCSYGGFVILNKIIQSIDYIEKTILMCPAINFCEIMERKSGISLDYFDSNDYMPLYNNIKIYNKAYLEFKNGDNNIKNYNFKNILMIQGINDKTVLYSDIDEFCLKNHLELKVIDEGKHELYGYDKEIVNYIVEFINK